MSFDEYSRGLWAQAFVFTVLAGDNFFFAFVPVLLLHFTVAWPVSPVNELPALDQRWFIVYNTFIVANGALCGMLAVYAMRTRVLVPTHTVVSRLPRMGIMFLMTGVIVGFRASVIASGAMSSLEPFWEEHQLIYIFAAILGGILVVAILVLTCQHTRPKNVWSWFTLSYRDDVYNYVISDYIIAGIVVLVPQAVWNILTPTIGLEFAGLITIAAEIVAWIGVYFWFTKVRTAATTAHFARAQSYVSFLEFVLITGGMHVGSAVIFLIMNAIGIESSFTGSDTWDEWIMGASIATSIVLFIVFGVRRKKSRSSKDGDKDIIFGAPAPARSTSYAQLEG